MAMAGMREKEEGLARTMWIKFRNESVYVLYAPFVVCLASGVLDPQSFIHYVSQEVFYLKAFAQAYGMVEQYADDDEDKDSIRKMRKLVLEKLDNYSDTVRGWGFEVASENSPDSMTVKYTDFLLATASGKIGEKFPGKIMTPFEKTKWPAYTIAAMAPCMRFHAYISKEILTLWNFDQSNHIYNKWIENLSSQIYEGMALEVEDLLEKLSVSLTGEELEVVENTYLQALKIEVQFFYAQPIFQQTIVPFVQLREAKEPSFSIFCDFDMTCTTINSSAVLAEIAIRTAPKSDVDVSDTQLARMPSILLRSTWGVISGQYTDEYEQCVDNITAGDKAGEFDYPGLCKALEKVSEFEKRANSRVIQSGVLKGLKREDMKRAGELLTLQHGCKKFFLEISKRETLQTDVHVLSYCWCSDMLRSAFSSGNMDVEDIYCNDLAYEDNITTGDMVRKVESPMEKLEAFNEKVTKQSDHVTICIGGTVGDVLCLLNADVGIVIDPSRSLTRLGAKFGISFVPLFSAVVMKQRELAEDKSAEWVARSGTLYTVESWAEIHAFIFGT